MPLSLKIFLFNLQKQIDEHLPHKQTVQDHSDHPNYPSCFQVAASGGIKEKNISVICIVLVFRARLSRTPQLAHS